MKILCCLVLMLSFFSQTTQVSLADLEALAKPGLPGHRRMGDNSHRQERTPGALTLAGRHKVTTFKIYEMSPHTGMKHGDETVLGMDAGSLTGRQSHLLPMF